jgi:hypothetical protein
VHAVQYALYSTVPAGQSVKKDLLRQAASPAQGFYGGPLEWSCAAAYDLTYDLYSAEERAKIEQALLDSCRAMQRASQRLGNANLRYIPYWQAGVMACVIGNDEILD